MEAKRLKTRKRGKPKQAENRKARYKKRENLIFCIKFVGLRALKGEEPRERRLPGKSGPGIVENGYKKRKNPVFCIADENPPLAFP